jgi:hypothetical protein
MAPRVLYAMEVLSSAECVRWKIIDNSRWQHIAHEHTIQIQATGQNSNFHLIKSRPWGSKVKMNYVKLLESDKFAWHISFQCEGNWRERRNIEEYDVELNEGEESDNSHIIWIIIITMAQVSTSHALFHDLPLLGWASLFSWTWCAT